MRVPGRGQTVLKKSTRAETGTNYALVINGKPQVIEENMFNEILKAASFREELRMRDSLGNERLEYFLLAEED